MAGLRLAWGEAVAVAVLFAAGLYLGLPAQAADLAFYQGDAARAAGLDPLQAHYHAALGTLPELRRAAALGDVDPGTYVRLGDLLAAAGDSAGARAAYRRAVEIYPYDPTARSRWASYSSSSSP